MDNREHHIFLLVSSILPAFGVLLAGYLVATGNVGASDLVAFGVLYVIASLGVSTGYHRLLAHRSFEVGPVLRYAFATAGAIAGQGPPIIWVAHHRRHHRYADKPGDPHSPYDVEDPSQPLTARGFWHSHLSWLLDQKLTSEPIRYCPDLVRDRGLRFISNHFVAVVLGGILLAGAIGFAVSGTVTGFLTGILWGGLVRIFVANHVTYAVNSVGHSAGSRRFATPEESRNVALLAIPSFGEAWHNNHHAFPRSYRHGLTWYEIDVSQMVIWVLEKLELARNVVRIDARTRARIEAGWRKRGSGRAGAASPQVPMASAKGGPIQATDVD